MNVIIVPIEQKHNFTSIVITGFKENDSLTIKNVH